MRDNKAVDQARQDADAERRKDRQSQRVRMQVCRDGNTARQGNHGACAEVDLTADDYKRRAAGDHNDRRVLLQNIDQVLRGKERLAQQRANADQQNENQHHAVLLCEGGYLVLFHHDYLPPSAARAIIFSDWISSFSKVPCTLPCAITTTRSHEPTISGNSEEIMIIAILHVVHRCNFLFKRQEQHIGRIAACGSICLFRLQTYLGGTEMSITKQAGFSPALHRIFS